MAKTATEFEDSVLVSRPSDGITIIAINRPRVKNAVDHATATKLYEAILEFEDDSQAKICILHGTEGTFCAGADLHQVSTSSNTNDSLVPFPASPTQRSQGPMGPSRLQVRKPLICAVSGYAVAGGLELSLLADMRVVEEDAVFGVFCRRWGVPLIDGGTVRLPAVIGLGRAMDMILTGRPVGAKEALSFGLANRVVPKGKALDEAVSLAKQLLKFPQLCMNLDRDSAYHGVFDASCLQDGLRYEFENGVEAVRVEGVKGAARFSGGLGRHGGGTEHI